MQIPHLLANEGIVLQLQYSLLRINQNPALLTFGILFYRWHNVLAFELQLKHPAWEDEELFQAARRLNIATLQNIIAYE